MEEEKKGQNPEVIQKEVSKTTDEPKITVKVLVKGEPKEADATVHTVQAPKTIIDNLNNAIFEKLVESVKSQNSLEESGEQQIVWLDARGAGAGDAPLTKD